MATVSASEAPSCRSVAATTSARMTAIPAPGGDPAMPGDALGPPGPGPACLVVGAPVRPVELVADLGQDHRQQRDRRQRRDQRDQHSAVAHRAQERQRQRDQREQADRDRDAAEDDRAAGGLHRPSGRPRRPRDRGCAPRASARRRSASSRSRRPGRAARSGTGRSARPWSARSGRAASRNVVMIDAIAISSGTTARNEAKTKTRTASAPRPPTTRLEQEARALVVGARVLEQGVEAGQVDRLAGDRRALERARTRPSRRPGSRRTPSPGPAAGRRRRNVVRPSSETKVSSPVEA